MNMALCGYGCLLPAPVWSKMYVTIIYYERSGTGILFIMICGGKEYTKDENG